MKSTNNMHKQTRLLESDIKAMVLNYLRNQNKLSQETTIINEFTVDGYSRRADLVVTDKKNLIAFEVKSEADSLHRLDGQTKKYLEYFDKVVIVAAPKHIDKIIRTVPQNVAVWEIHDGGFKIKQRGKIVPIANKFKLMDLMKANELLKLSNKLSLLPKSKNRYATKQVLENAPLATLRNATIQYIEDRFQMTNFLFWQNVQTSQILPEHIELLSPYKEERQFLTAEKVEIESFWKSWSTLLVEDPHFVTMSQRQNKQVFGCPPEHIQRLLVA